MEPLSDRPFQRVAYVCPVCHRTSQPAVRLQSTGPRPSAWHVCGNCGLLWEANAKLGRSDVLFLGGVRAENVTIDTTHHHIERVLSSSGQPWEQLAAYLLGYLGSRAPVGTRWLDVGCAAGVLIDALRGHRPDDDIVGVDICPDCVAFAMSRGHTVYQADLSDGPLDIPPRDLVVANELFEHVRDPLRMSLGIQAMLRQGGLAWLKFARSDVDELHGGEWHYWTPTAVATLLDRTGWTLVELTASSTAYAALVEKR